LFFHAKPVTAPNNLMCNLSVCLFFLRVQRVSPLAALLSGVSDQHARFSARYSPLIPFSLHGIACNVYYVLASANTPYNMNAFLFCQNQRYSPAPF
jgi:hypothetical protein